MWSSRRPERGGTGDIDHLLYIRPVGAVEDALVRELRKDLAEYLGARVRILPAMAIPEGCFESARNQYYSTKVLRELIREVPEDAGKILGLIDKDLCIPILTFVFGEAQLGGIGSIVSLARLRQEFHGLAPDREVLYERLYKEALHELGHTYGLVHCPDGNCVMYLSNTVLDVDRKKGAFCRRCAAELGKRNDSRRE